VLLLEKLDVLLAKMSEEEIRADILPLTFAMLESNSIQGQASLLTYSPQVRRCHVSLRTCNS